MTGIASWRLTDHELEERVEAFKRLGSYAAVARELDINESSVRRSLQTARRKNMLGDFIGGQLPEGYTLGKVTSLVGPDGVRMEWQHRHPDVEAVESHIEQLIAAMDAEITPLPLVELASYRQVSDQVTLYPVVDVHLGLYAWGKESGENYDLPIAKAQFMASVSDLMSETPASEEALIVVLGDFFHADNNNAQTEKSHNHLDVDGRHDKTLFTGIELIIWQIDMALQKHDHVTVHVTRGNHDPYASKALNAALWFRYENNPRVLIDRSPAELWSFEWGETMLSFTHGDMIKAADMPGVMAAYEPGMWGRTKHRFAYSGHFHRSAKGPYADEKNGARWEILPAFTAKDAWNRGMGHASARAITAITFRKVGGWKSTNNVAVGV